MKGNSGSDQYVYNLMSTVPKLTYAKVGKSSKAKAESVSSELLRSKEQKRDDLFSHMNQENLNYIKKQLKLKKNRSDIDRPSSPPRDASELAHVQQDEATQRYKIYQKYRGEEEVSEKEPHLQDTQRRSDEEKPLNILLPEDIEEDYHPSQSQYSKHINRERQKISSSHHGITFTKPQERAEANAAKMYQSLPYEDPKKRMASIEGFFGEVVSVNLKQDYGLFLQSLEEYLVDLNHSKHLQAPIDKKRTEEIPSQRKKSASRQGSHHKVKEKTDLNTRQAKSKIDKNRKKDTFGQNSNLRISYPNHQSFQSSSSLSKCDIDYDKKLKQQKLNNILLAQEIQRLRKLLNAKEQVISANIKIIKKIEIDKDFLNEELRHVKIQQQILNKSKKPFHDEYLNKYGQFEKHKKGINNENAIKIGDFQSISNHHRHTSTNPHRATNRTLSSARPADEFNELFQQFATTKQSREASQEKMRKQSESLEKLQKEYQNFVFEEKKNPIYRGISRKWREGVV